LNQYLSKLCGTLPIPLFKIYLFILEREYMSRGGAEGERGEKQTPC